MSCTLKTKWLSKICFALSFLLIFGCSPEKETQLAGNLYGFNHVKDTAVNWFKVNGYEGRGAAGTCCIMIPPKWTPGKTVLVEWEVDPNPYPSDSPGVGDPKFDDYMKKHRANYRHYSKRVEVPEYGEPCDVQVHFLPCQEVKITLSCYTTSHPDYPIKEPNDMEEPTECPISVSQSQ